MSNAALKAQGYTLQLQIYIYYTCPKEATALIKARQSLLAPHSLLQQSTFGTPPQRTPQEWPRLLPLKRELPTQFQTAL